MLVAALTIAIGVANAQFSQQKTYKNTKFIPLDALESSSSLPQMNLMVHSSQTECQFLDCKLLCDSQPRCSVFTFSKNICTLGNVVQDEGEEEVVAWVKLIQQITQINSGNSSIFTEAFSTLGTWNISAFSWKMISYR